MNHVSTFVCISSLLGSCLYFGRRGVFPPTPHPTRRAPDMATQHSVAGVPINAAVRLMKVAADFASAGIATVHTNPSNIDVGVDIDVFAMPVGACADFDGRPCDPGSPLRGPDQLPWGMPRMTWRH